MTEHHQMCNTTNLFATPNRRQGQSRLHAERSAAHTHNEFNPLFITKARNVEYKEHCRRQDKAKYSSN